MVSPEVSRTSHAAARGSGRYGRASPPGGPAGVISSSVKLREARQPGGSSRPREEWPTPNPHRRVAIVHPTGKSRAARSPAGRREPLSARTSWAVRVGLDGPGAARCPPSRPSRPPLAATPSRGRPASRSAASTKVRWAGPSWTKATTISALAAAETRWKLPALSRTVKDGVFSCRGRAQPLERNRRPPGTASRGHGRRRRSTSCRRRPRSSARDAPGHSSPRPSPRPCVGGLGGSRQRRPSPVGA